MASPLPRNDRPSFYSSQRPGSLLFFYLGVFFTFAPVMLLSTSSLAQARPWRVIVFWTVVSGLVGVAWAVAFTVRPRLIGVVVAAQVLIAVAMGLGWPPGVALRPATVSAVTLGMIVSLAAGYFLFVKYIAVEGAKTLRMQTELALARRIHDALVPAVDVSVLGGAGRVRVYGRSDTSTEMGGDLIDIHTREDGSVEVVLADVSGHGVKAGVVMAMVKSALHTRRLRPAGLAELLGDLNRVLVGLVDPGMFATVAVVRVGGTSGLDGGASGEPFPQPPPSGRGSARAEFALAGHLPVLHWRAASGTWAELPAASMPVGLMSDAEFESGVSEPVGPGDVFVLYTDGLTEVRDSGGRQLGVAGFRAIVERHIGEAELSRIFENVLGEVRERGAQGDDQTLVVVRIEGGGA